MSAKSEKAVSGLLSQVQEGIWQQLAFKAVSKMPKFKLAAQTNRILEQTTTMICQARELSRPIAPQIDIQQTVSDNILFGSVKWSSVKPGSSQTLSRTRNHSQIIIAKQKKIKTHNYYRRSESIQLQKNQICIKTAVQKEEKALQQRQINNQQDKMREKLEKNRLFRDTMVKKQKQQQSIRQHHSQQQKRRFKQIKTYTFDYQGRVLSRGIQKQSPQLKVIDLRADYGKRKLSYKPPKRNIQSQNIDKINVINEEESWLTQLLASKQKQKQQQNNQKIRKSLDANKDTSLFDAFRQDKCLSVGVQITDQHSHQQLDGGSRDKNDLRKITFNQFKVRLPRQNFKMGEWGNKTYTGEASKTEVVEYRQERRYKTQMNEESRGRMTSSSFNRGGRWGKIRVSNQTLYTQHFNDSNF